MVYGYNARAINEFGLKELREVTFATSPEVLRALADSLKEAAEELEGANSIQWHRHIPTSLSKLLGCDVVICRSTESDDLPNLN
jgi:hypothetical protein